MSRKPPPVLVSFAGATALLLAGCAGQDGASGGGSDAGSAPAATADSSSPGSEPATPASSPSSAPATAPEVAGMVVHQSDVDVETTVDRLSTALGSAGMVVATVDHAAAAEEVGLELDPTVLVIGGNPEAGTPLMLAEQEAGLDLPQKYLVWQVEDAVYLGYNSAEFLAEQADIDDASALQGLSEGSATIAAEASGSEAPVSDGAYPEDDISVESLDSDGDFATTVERLETAVDEGGLLSVAVVDHAQGAESIGERLDPTTVAFAGNPEVGTKFMQQAQTMGIDLPLRFLITEDDEGEVEVSYPAIGDLADRHGVEGLDDVVAMVEQGTSSLAGAAAGS